MKKNKGFTLIELLAVIVILAVIALIATPIIMNVISDSKKGIKPSDNGMITLDNGNVVSATFVIDAYQAHYNGKEVLVGNNYGAGEVIFYNPETNKKCNSRELNQTDTAKTGCLRWDVITTDDNENKTNIDIMLDHNTTPRIAWVSKEDYIAAGGTEAEYGDRGNSSKGPLTALKQLNIDTNSWFSTVKSTARMISAEEVTDIIGIDNWGSNQTSITAAPWLYQNLDMHNMIGYWTSTARMNSSDVAWRVYAGKMLTGGTVYADNGIRPVITVAKSVLS